MQKKPAPKKAAPKKGRASRVVMDDSDDDEAEEVKSAIDWHGDVKAQTDSCQTEESDAQETCAEEAEARTDARA